MNRELRMRDQLLIEPALPGDAEWCAKVMSGADPWIRLGRTHAVCLERLTRAGSELYIARRDGARAGFLLLDRHGVAGSPYVASVACAAEVRGQGIGSAMLAFAERRYPDARFIFLCVSSFNVKARRLYERLGYALVGTLKDYIINGVDEHLMMKRLGDR